MSACCGTEGVLPCVPAPALAGAIHVPSCLREHEARPRPVIGTSRARPSIDACRGERAPLSASTNILPPTAPPLPVGVVPPPPSPSAVPVALCRRSRCCLRRLLAGIIFLQTTMADPRDAEIADLKKQLAEIQNQLVEIQNQLAKERARADAAERKVIERMLPGAIAYALAEDARYRRSMLTGRCGVVAGW